MSKSIACDVIAELGELHFGRKVFLDTPTDIHRTIRYIEENPLQWRLPRQQWLFVKPYDGWPLHPGHSPNSPYARALRDHKE